MRFISVFSVITVASVITLSAVAQKEEETDSTTSSESLTKLDTAQAATDESAETDDTSETIDALVESMVDTAVSMFGLTLSGDLFDDAIADLETNWSKEIEQFDTDNNGSLSLEELENVPEEEWTDDYKALPADEREKALKSQFKELDADDDGEVTTEEVVKHVETQLETFNELIKGLELSPSAESDDDASDTVE